EILAADLSSFALDLAAWGAVPDQLAFLDPPPRAALTEAHALLRELGAIDGDGRITEQGKKLRRLPLPPRLARMVIDADIRARIEALHRDRSPRAREARAMAARWADFAAPRSGPPANKGGERSAGALLALAYPERIARNRGGGSGAFLLASGRGAQIDPASPLAREPFLAVAELTGSAAAGRILLAAPITLAATEARFGGGIETREEIAFDAASASLRGRKSRKLGALLLSEQPMRVVPGDESEKKLAGGIA